MSDFTLGRERGGSVVECRTPEREVQGSRPTAAVLCPWARHFTPRKYWLITQEVMAPSRHDWKIVDWDVKPQHNYPWYVRLIPDWWYYPKVGVPPKRKEPVNIADRSIHLIIWCAPDALFNVFMHSGTHNKLAKVIDICHCCWIYL